MSKNYKGVDGRWYDLRDAADYAACMAVVDARYHELHGPAHTDGTTCGSTAAAPVEDLRPASQRNGHTAVADPEAKARLAEALAYVAGYVGTWGLPLDIRSDPRFGTKWMRLSERQVEALLAGKARDAQRAEQAEISREIFAADEYAKAVAAPVVLTPKTPEIIEGMWLLGDGIVKVQRALARGSGQLYAKRLDPETGDFLYEAGLIRRMAGATKMTVEQAKAYGLLYGRCIVCGRTLTDEYSIANGIGPICAGKGEWAA